MRKLLFSPAALNDLDGIYDYTFENWGIDQAEHYVRELHGTCNNLASGNITGRNVDFIRQGYFKKPCGSHFVFYKYSNPKILEVIRILHQRMDIEAQLI
ncbi:MAG: type II toxin-antitoxin system RelE/ParE family toxin [Rhizobiaceae bacterium]|nr:type II toxin-antitoxin system RelE/ParE family toxin [Rhizobiaceae bacterium]